MAIPPSSVALDRKNKKFTGSYGTSFPVFYHIRPKNPTAAPWFFSDHGLSLRCFPVPVFFRGKQADLFETGVIDSRSCLLIPIVGDTLQEKEGEISWPKTCANWWSHCRRTPAIP
jgi:hypothetical protein